jgi:hypothetical protein
VKAARFSGSEPDSASHARNLSKERSMARSESDPIHHTQKMQKRLQETMQHLHEDIEKVHESQLKAMFETSAEVLGGLVKAFRD